MFAMLRGPWPRRTSTGVDIAALEKRAAAGDDVSADLDAALDMLLGEALAAQLEAGFELVSDGTVPWADPVSAVLEAVARGDVGPDGMLARAFRAASERVSALATGMPDPSAVTVAASVPGPWTLAVRDVGVVGDHSAVMDRAASIAGVLAVELRVLRDAGCGVVIVDEPAATTVETDAQRDAWLRAHRMLLRDAADLHAMLAIAGGDAAHLGSAAIAAVPYASVLVDLIEGPDNWYLVRDLPGERGIVCAALKAAAGAPLGDQSPQLVWAAHYAASMGGRGLVRVGLANASSLADLAPAEARAVLDAMARAARFSLMSREEARSAGFDERAWRTMPGRPERPAT